MKIFTFLFLLLSGGLLLSLSGCAADEEMGLCTTLGACPSKADCDGDDCEEAPEPEAPKKTGGHSTGGHDIGTP